MNRTADQLHNLADALSEDIVATPPEILLAEAAEEHGDDAALAAGFDRIVARAERQARWRRAKARLRALVPSSSLRSWRPALAAIAGIAVIVISGDVYLHVATKAPLRLLASAPPPLPPAAPASSRSAFNRDVVTAPPRLSHDERRADAGELAGAPAAQAPPPPPPAAALGEPKRVRTVPFYGGLNAANPTQPPALADYQRARVAREKSTAPAAPPQQLAAAPAAATAESRDEIPSFTWPLRGQVIADAAAKKAGTLDRGIDIAVPVGTPVHAAADGVVIYAGESAGYGNLILVRHSGGFITAYAHADRMLVKVNDNVRRGQVIAASGQTGAVAQPLLHFEIRKGTATVDPRQYLH